VSKQIENPVLTRHAKVYSMAAAVGHTVWGLFTLALQRPQSKADDCIILPPRRSLCLPGKNKTEKRYLV
jgi:hypothetical protein